MTKDDVRQELLEYLKEEGPTNTFSLSSKFDIDRDKLLAIAKSLEKKQAVKFERGNIVFLKFPSEEITLVKKPLLKLEKKVGRVRARKTKTGRKSQIVEKIQEENKGLKERLQGLEASQTGHIAKLKEKIKELEQKAARPARIIRRTIIKRIPVKVKETTPRRKKSKKTFGKIKISKFQKFNLLKKALKKIQRFRLPGV